MSTTPSTTWLPAAFAHPTHVEVGLGHHLRPIRASDVDLDHPAVMGSRERLWSVYGEAWGWPPATMTHEQDREDLARHAAEMVTEGHRDPGGVDEVLGQPRGLLGGHRGSSRLSGSARGPRRDGQRSAASWLSAPTCRLGQRASSRDSKRAIEKIVSQSGPTIPAMYCSGLTKNNAARPPRTTLVHPTNRE